MSKQKVTVEIDVPDGYKATGELRYPVPLVDYYLLINPVRVGHLKSLQSTTGPRFILRKSWEPPAWLPDGCWVYLNGHSKKWIVTNKEPEWYRGFGSCIDGCWENADYATCIGADELASIHYGETFTPPPVEKIQIDRRPQRAD